MKILLCEDELDTAQVIVLMLESAGHEVHFTDSADQALTLLGLSQQPGQTPFEMIITDISLPGHTGLYMAKMARDSGYRGRMAALTAHSEETVRDVLDQVNAEYWGKPESIEKLTALVERRAVPRESVTP